MHCFQVFLHNGMSCIQKAMFFCFGTKRKSEKKTATEWTSFCTHLSDYQALPKTSPESWVWFRVCEWLNLPQCRSVYLKHRWFRETERNRITQESRTLTWPSGLEDLFSLLGPGESGPAELGGWGSGAIFAPGESCMLASWAAYSC